jgi:hypothetical protein
MVEKKNMERKRGDRLVDAVADIERIETDAWTDLFTAAPTDSPRISGWAPRFPATVAEACNAFC